MNADIAFITSNSGYIDSHYIPAQQQTKKREPVNVSVGISKSDNLGGNQNGVATNGTRQDQ